MRSAHPSAPLTGPDAPSPLENFLDLHSRKVVIGLAVVVAMVATFTTLHLKKKKYAEKAGAALVAAKDLDGLRKVVSEFADTPAGQTAQILLADRQLDSGDAKGATDTLRTFLGANKDHPLASQARLALASALLQLGQPEEAGSELSSFLAAAPTSPLAPLAMIMQAEIAEKKGDIEGAKKIYGEVKAGFPESQFAGKASMRLERVGFILPIEVEPPPPPAPPEPVPTVPPLPTPDAGSETPLLDGEQPLPLPGTPMPPGLNLTPPAGAGGLESPADDIVPPSPPAAGQSPVPETP